jgi:DNA-binding NarL/FixJ family response regulator
MTARSIPGRLDYAALTGRDQHRPVDRDTARAAAVELRARGLTVEDIGQALGLTSGAVRDLLEVKP